MACKIINLCIILHNTYIQYVSEADPENEDINVLDFGMMGNEVLHEENDNITEHEFRRVNQELADGRRVRMRIIEQFRRQQH
ncbi:hypothetical protein BDFB_013001 [Asbolus verrucosus]|uniref:Uncharacterized protein n=1 Tax=Asbolus verrucosus TaxID=1661398 RepID=A0A482W6I3_ASBVE|nr:hypothetical protein BDFB_013001 [Asbolus verrucosus]